MNPTTDTAIEAIIHDHNKAMRADMASKLQGGSRSPAITDVITCKAIQAIITQARIDEAKWIKKMSTHGGLMDSVATFKIDDRITQLKGDV